MTSREGKFKENQSCNIQISDMSTLQGRGGPEILSFEYE